jgi:CheY-like chemotaxis protein
MSRDAVDRAASLVKRLLTFSRRQRLQPKPVDADGLISGMADLIRRTMGPSVGVELKLRDGAGTVVCDPNELESALLNLCINARDAMPNGGRLTIGTEDVRLSAIERFRAGVTVSDFVAFYVADTGIGMTQDVQERAFEPFFTTKPVGEGTGLGLSQVYGFARQSGGLVRLESGPGHGTVIRLLLPLHGWSEAAVLQPAAKAEEQHATNGEAVLLVDDEDTVRQPAAERLRELGYRVLEAAEGSAALHLLDQGAQFDLLVTDVGLPHGMNGRQLAEAVRDRMPDVMVLFMTGYAATHLPPGTQVIGKPFELDALIGRIQALIEEKRSASAGRVPDLE